MAYRDTSSTPWAKAIGQVFQRVRTGANLSVPEFAQHLGVTPNAVQAIETGRSKPSLYTYLRAQQVLGLFRLPLPDAGSGKADGNGCGDGGMS